MTRILNLHRRNTSNVGDIKTSPFDYFSNKGWTVRKHDLLDCQNESSRESWERSFNDAECIVIGGGGLLDIDFFEGALAETYARRRASQRLVLWGAGHNHYWVGGWSQMRRHVDLLPYNYDLVGLRDVSDTYKWAPCVSCMDPIFDNSFDIKRNVVLYKHVEMVLGEFEMSILPPDITIIDNYTPFEEVIETLGSSRLVLTSSFHGAYWATLLKRKVVAFPFSSKFYGLKHSVPLCDVRDWQRYSKLARVYPDALSECRSASVDFHEEFKSLLSAG
ncbi:polysaccharide pyruvyl transferase family protein [Rhizobium skierniewicense]|uniref:polysaccharide pyruvyl transferase family protein n=1 Tax=Rhizobium skierniewicense TaxID=984260 RepID=UPI003D6E9B44|nr:polysaccharide pyruvyl transferase family protein [Rhizobium skierniewicense]